MTNQSSYTGWNNRSSRSRYEGEVVLLTVQRCDGSKAFPSDNQHNNGAAFPQERMRLENVDPKNTHLTLSHGFLSPVVRSQQVRSQHENYSQKGHV
ncbi:unnamed protein product [Schistosoma margrebowiei]|uniref:Uncharacterized protein n=1 Tax=Schistosoma margrebowiei TaxID=48269 RepID=A0A3P7Z021_9TREM|nr:unnamed protein product [Schistosoma margrebowiei]